METETRLIIGDADKLLSRLIHNCLLFFPSLLSPSQTPICSELYISIGIYSTENIFPCHLEPPVAFYNELVNIFWPPSSVTFAAFLRWDGGWTGGWQKNYVPVMTDGIGLHSFQIQWSLVHWTWETFQLIQEPHLKPYCSCPIIIMSFLCPHLFDFSTRASNQSPLVLFNLFFPRLSKGRMEKQYLLYCRLTGANVHGVLSFHFVYRQWGHE